MLLMHNEGQILFSKRSDKFICFSIIFVLSLLFFSAISHPIDVGGDAVSRWLLISDSHERQSFLHTLTSCHHALAECHHALRWGGNYPGYLVVDLFGAEPLSYYIAPIVFASASIAVLWLLAYEIGGVSVACLSVLAFFLYDRQHNLVLQMLPSAFGLFYLCAAAYFFILYLRNHKSAYLLVFAAFAFLSYGAKETNLFFLPAVYLFLIWRRNWRGLLILSLSLAAFFLVETLIVNAVLGNGLSFGRLEALLSGDHIDRMKNYERFSHYEYSDILRRWTRLNGIKFNLFAVFFLSSLAAIVFHKKLRDEELFLVFWGVSFAFFTTFFIVSLDPLRLGQPLRNRYLIVLAPFAAITVAWVFERASRLAVTWLGGRGIPLPYRPASKLVVPLLLSAILVVALQDARYRWHREDGYQRYGVWDANAQFERVSRILQNNCPIYFLRKKAAVASLIVLAAYRRDVSWQRDYEISTLSAKETNQRFSEDFRGRFSRWTDLSEMYLLRLKGTGGVRGCAPVFGGWGGLLVDSASGKSLR